MDQFDEKEFKKSFDIDVRCLDDEGLRHQKKLWYYGKLYVKAVRRFDELVAKLKLTEADVDSYVREDPESFGLQKITEPGVKRAILRSEEFQRAQRDVDDAKEEVNTLEVANRLLDHERTILTMLNSQDERNYLSKPREGKDRGQSASRRPLKRKHHE